MAEGGDQFCTKRTINRAMIGRECHAHQRCNRRLTILHDHALLTCTNREDGGMGRVDDRGEMLDAEHAEIGHSRCAALIFIRLELAIARTTREIFHLV